MQGTPAGEWGAGYPRTMSLPANLGLPRPGVTLLRAEGGHVHAPAPRSSAKGLGGGVGPLGTVRQSAEALMRGRQPPTWKG